MTDVTIYHNPRCSKSRQTLQLLEENGIEPTVVKYLDETPSADTLADVISKLGISPRDLLRTKEAPYKELNLADASLSDAQIIEAMVANPKLIERPIVVKGDAARIGRPPESVLELF
ncbi:MAG: arsenate reductase (glutaredoxin) [Pontibacterium sp.]